MQKKWQRKAKAVDLTL